MSRVLLLGPLRVSPAARDLAHAVLTKLLALHEDSVFQFLRWHSLENFEGILPGKLFLNLQEVLLGVRTDLGTSSALHELLHFAPLLAKEPQGLHESLVLLIRPPANNLPLFGLGAVCLNRASKASPQALGFTGVPRVH